MNEIHPTNPEKEQLPTHIAVMRHGPTTWNLQKRIQGNVDTDIVPETINEYLEKVGVTHLLKPDRIITSGLKRTQQTAEAVCRYRQWHDIPMEVISQFNEKKWGIFEGKTNAEAKEILLRNDKVVKAYPALATSPEMEPIWEDDSFQVEGGESIDQVRERVHEGLQILGEKYPGLSLLLIVHIGVMQSLGFDAGTVTNFELVKNPTGKFSYQTDSDGEKN